MDDDPRAVYFRQARFGMFGRMALLLTLSKLPFERAGHHEIGADPGIRCSNHKCITRSELYVPLHGKVGDRCPYWRCRAGDAAVIKESVAEQVRKERRDEKSHKAFRPCVCFENGWFDLVSYLIIEQKDE